MSASTSSVPAQIGWGRFPSTLAALALVVILAVAVAIVALNGTKAAPAVDSGAKGAPPPAFIDHGSRGEMPAPQNVPFHDSDVRVAPYIITDPGTGGFGGWGGPRAGSSTESSGGHNGTRLAQ
jgi:hypothetical protein